MISYKNTKSFCSEDISFIENYEAALADNSQVWLIHHRLETHKYKDRSRNEWVKRDENIPHTVLKSLGLYYKRPASELIFMTRAAHVSLHMKNNRYCLGHKHTDEWKQYMSEIMKGRTFSEESLKKISESAKRRPSNAKGTYWYNNGIINVRTFKCPEGFVPGRVK